MTYYVFHIRVDPQVVLRPIQIAPFAGELDQVRNVVQRNTTRPHVIPVFLLPVVLVMWVFRFAQPFGKRCQLIRHFHFAALLVCGDCTFV